MAGPPHLTLTLSTEMAEAVGRWKEYQISERRYLLHTLRGYDRELQRFLKFQMQHLQASDEDDNDID